MPTFTIIVGIVTLLGFILQVRDVFPKHKETRTALLFVSLGIFIGSLVGSISKISITIQNPQNPIYLIVVSFLILLLLTIVITIIMALLERNDADKRHELYLTAGICSIVFVIISGLTAGVSSITSVKEDSFQELNIDELIVLSDTNLKQNQYDRAIKFLNDIGNKIDQTIHAIR